MSEEIEKISAEIHKCYCRAYENRFGKPYWTNGDYSLLDEPTKDYDREMARWHISELSALKSKLDVYREQEQRWLSQMQVKDFDACNTLIDALEMQKNQIAELRKMLHE